MTTFEKKIAEIIRVDHAGEKGAQVIYDGQIAALKIKGDVETLELVKHMKQQENTHFDYFNNEIKKQKIRPTLMQPIWKVGGFALGFLTALVDKKAAMTCTTAVEEVIDEHYREQLESLNKEEEFLNEDQKQQVKVLKEKIEKFRQEELQHRDIGYENKAAELGCFSALSKLIKFTTKSAITISKKL
jgi:ubiquinone biosynthesis monooxygenase Coq7